MNMRKSNLERHLVNCPHCGKEVLDHFTQCPHCKGELTPRGYTEGDAKSRTKIRNILFVVLLVIAVAVLVTLKS